eukprot:7382793-Prymnesium_polylepis.1
MVRDPSVARMLRRVLTPVWSWGRRRGQGCRGTAVLFNRTALIVIVIVTGSLTTVDRFNNDAQ